MPNLGYAFAPSFENAEMGRQGGSPPTAPQGALQTINYQLPARFAGAPGGLSPLQGQDMAGQGRTSAVIQSILRTVLGPGAGLMGGGDQGAQDYLQSAAGQPPPVMRPPVVHPGGGNGRRAEVEGMMGATSLPMSPGEGGPLMQQPYGDWIRRAMQPGQGPAFIGSGQGWPG